MFKFVANLTFLFNEVPFIQRFKAAKKAGFKYVEFMFPYDYDLDEIKDQLEKNDLQLILFNLPVGNWDLDDRGLAVDPKFKLKFNEGVQSAIDIALKLDVKKLNCLVGNKCDSYPDNETWDNLVDNIRYAASELHKYNIDLMIESINHYDMPKFYLNTTNQVFDLINAVDRPNVYLQYDVYHASREGEDHSLILKNHFNKIGHIQVADTPERTQPGTGLVNYEFIFKELEDNNYSGYLSMEYKPSPNTIESLDWLNKFGYEL
ncbi:MAG: TIM barrel protein [Gudongella sp.]|nr:TIM barrel protein [Gudongella sp.]